jgi:DNA-binding transcriptional regulator PaaX
MENINIKKAVLATIAIGGLMTVAIVAPNAVQILKPFLKNKKALANKQYYIKNAVLRSLASRGLVTFTVNKMGQRCVAITAKGRQELERYELGELKIPKPKFWDSKYRIIAFDIKESRRAVRDELRFWLADLGFVRLQNSVWVYPYECREVITLLKSRYRIGKDVLYMTVESIDNDAWLKKHFHLS